VANIGRRLLALALVLAGAPALAGVTAEVQRQIRGSTFEVVMKKPPEGSVRYEKPLPLELLPYVERTDAYRSIGTAFAISPNTYVTAAHVLTAGVDSQYGAPALRAADGTVHPIATIEKFSASEDFVVFSLADALNPLPLSTNRSPHLDDPVLAVGNALGEGIVIRDGLFTSETPEAQDGRWKWIRFSAAASPGNSGGPLLDAAGHVIGVVVMKSPNENLNYALPIANVLDAPPSKARFDERVLTKLSFAQGSKSYALKDEFALPLSWEKFVRAYQTLMERHSSESLEALLAAYASTMFPKGSGTEAIFYGPDATNHEPALVTQQADGNWAIQASEFQFTDLPGDGKVGVSAVAGAFLLDLHRGEASDDAFYGDSKSLMDVALKALNLRRAVGGDHVRVVSLGSALTEATTTDAYGRKWQLRVWPVPYLDMYLVTQLLPTPDGYVGLVEYAPSSGLRDTKIQLSLLANQITLTYQGTLAQWRTFLARPALLPGALKDLKLESGSGWKLHTPRFESGVPPSLMQLDSHSRLLMAMNYTPDGARVVWDIGGACWYRDAQQEKAYLGLLRRPRPPATAKLELRSRFDDLQARRAPYDGSPVRVSGDAIDVMMALPAPGTKAGTESSDVVYEMSLRLEGHPSMTQMATYQDTALQATRILERGVGQDVAAAAPATMSTALDAELKALREGSRQCDQAGRDIRGRLCSEDVEQFIVPLYQTSFQTPLDSAAVNDLQKSFLDGAQAFDEYWKIAPDVVHNRDVWRPFLAHNHLPDNTPHDAVVLAAESSLSALLSKGGPPTADWIGQSQALGNAYVDERARMARRLASENTTVSGYRQRKSLCPAAVLRTSGTDKPVPGAVGRSLEEFYPVILRRLGVEGLVVLSVKVNSYGCAVETAVAESSGSDELDEAALRWVETASFLPAEKDGKAVDGTGQVAVNFRLHP
jgi:TonB family protein